MVNEAAIAAAIEDLESQEKPNYARTARKWNVDRGTLARRYSRKTNSDRGAASKYRKKLTNEQEEALLQNIETMANMGVYCTPQIVTNLVLELTKEPVSISWVTRFCKRYKDRITSPYLLPAGY
ncbi:hypothetical protein MferCBS31731_003252 [Microsporum ferrugineum]